MTDTTLMPYSFQRTDLLPPAEDVLATPGMVQGVVITLPADLCGSTLAQCFRWFADRDEVILIDSGVSQKAEHGDLLLEWEGCEIDPLFLALLRDDDDILDYLLYERDTEEVEHA